MVHSRRDSQYRGPVGYWNCPLSHKVLEDSHWDVRVVMWRRGGQLGCAQVGCNNLAVVWEVRQEGRAHNWVQLSIRIVCWVTVASVEPL